MSSKFGITGSGDRPNDDVTCQSTQKVMQAYTFFFPQPYSKCN